MTTQGHGGGGEPDGVDRAADEDPDVRDDRQYPGVGMPAWPCEHDSLVVVVVTFVVVVIVTVVVIDPELMPMIRLPFLFCFNFQTNNLLQAGRFNFTPRGEIQLPKVNRK